MSKRKPSVRERLVAPWMLLFTVSISYGAMISNDVQDHFRVQANSDVVVEEGVVTTVVEVEQDAGAGQPAPTPSPTPPTIEEYIYQVFGDDGELMVEIAKCESKLDPERIGDKHLMGMLDGEMIGDSIGLFQIRTGDAGVYDSKPWNRAKANGMTVEEFRTAMKDPYKNIDYAKQILDRQGINAWFHCANKVQSK